MTNNTPSGYDQSRTIGEVTFEWANSITEQLAAGEIDGDSGYGFDASTVVSVTIAGGGPGADVAFEFASDGYLQSATLHYYEMAGSASYRFDDEVAVGLADAFGAREILSVVDDGQRAW